MSENTPRPSATAGLTPEEKRRVLRGLLQAPPPPGESRLSAAQFRLWEMDAAEPSSGVHCFAIASRLKGVIDPARFARALAVVQSRHAGLHSRITTAEGFPRFEPDTDLPLPFEFRENTPRDADQLVRDDARRPFDLTAQPGWRAILYRQEANRDLLLLQFHHILADRWSVAVIMGDLSDAYTALSDGSPVPACDLAPPWTAARKHESWLESAEAGAQFNFWRECFASPPATVLLPFARSSGGLSGYAGERFETVLDPQTAAQVKQVAADRSTTAFPVLLTAWALTLRAHTSQEDFVICTPVTGRHRAGTRNAIGYFNNILPLRLRLEGCAGFSEALASVAAAARQSYANQDLPFHQIAGLPELAPVRSTACMFAVQNIPGLELRLPDVESEYFDVPNGTSNFDLSLFLEEKRGLWHVICDYKTSAFDASGIRTLVERFLEVLRFALRQPDAALESFPRFSPETAPAAANAEVPAIAAAHNVLEPVVTGFFQSLFPGADIHPDTNFFEAGGDSLQASRLFARIHSELSVELPLATLLEAPTPRTLAARAGDRNWKAPWMSLVPVKAEGTRPPLFFVHGGGGNVLSFRLLSSGLAADQPMYCLQAKGLKRGEKPLESVEEMASHYIDAIRTARPKGPYALAGHSLGAAVAYEMAQRLRREGEAVAFLGLLDHPGPNLELDRLDWIRYHYLNFARLKGQERIEYVYHGVRSRVGRLRAKAASGQVKHRSTAEMLEHGMRALQNYKIQPYPGRIDLFRARMGSPNILSDPSGGWGGLAKEGVAVHEVPGTHLSMLDHPNVEVLGAEISRCLARA